METRNYTFGLIISGLVLALAPAAGFPIHAQEISEGTGSTTDEVKAILKRETKSDTTYIVRKYDFIEQTVSQSPIDTAANLDFHLGAAPKLYLTPNELQQTPTQYPDPMAEQLRRRYLDIPSTAPLNGLARSLKESFESSEKKPLDELPLPNDTEIEILKTLWPKTIASSSEIYAELDSTIQLTSEDLNDLLREMTERGFLGRKKISPAHKFTVFGLFSFEISAKNKKNQLYVYWPLVSKQDLIRYLDAKRYVAFTAAQKSSTNGRTELYHKYLTMKLNRLIQ